jgi:hypothetical protein
MQAGVLRDCAPLPRCMLGIDSVRLSGRPLPDNPGGRDWVASALAFAVSVPAWRTGGSGDFHVDKYLFPISVRVCSAAGFLMFTSVHISMQHCVGPTSRMAMYQ